MRNKEKLKRMDNAECVDFLKKISTMQFGKYVDWKKWLQQEDDDSLPYIGEPAQYKNDTGVIYDCNILAKKNMFGNKYVQILRFDPDGTVEYRAVPEKYIL